MSRADCSLEALFESPPCPSWELPHYDVADEMAAGVVEHVRLFNDGLTLPEVHTRVSGVAAPATEHVRASSGLLHVDVRQTDRRLAGDHLGWVSAPPLVHLEYWADAPAGGRAHTLSLDLLPGEARELAAMLLAATDALTRTGPHADCPRRAVLAPDDPRAAA